MENECQDMTEHNMQALNLKEMKLIRKQNTHKICRVKEHLNNA